MLLGRQEDQIYSGDEVVKIETLASQIAITVDSDRKKKLAIVVSERQRLLRDLHDSVSQKLYGLVTLTEAVQAAREAGAELNLTNYHARIGENARQAVKEMRLFLYQLQPVDIEKEGLVSVLHYRLAAVEGRADIKARLLADDDIRLSGEKQITLFFVAQEALNNVLRHAQAREVTVTLKQGRKHVHLHIMDDGRGFDPGKLEKGGLGLNNMWERVLLVGGTFRIRSKPGEGTMILVSVPLEN
jgi:signal transduction histidine kinase